MDPARGDRVGGTGRLGPRGRGASRTRLSTWDVLRRRLGGGELVTSFVSSSRIRSGSTGVPVTIATAASSATREWIEQGAGSVVEQVVAPVDCRSPRLVRRVEVTLAPGQDPELPVEAGGDLLRGARCGQ